MGKAEFLKALEGELSPRIPAEDLADVLAYYEEYIADAGEDQEEAVLGELGSPAAVAAKILEDQGEPKPGKPQSRTKRVLLRFLLWGLGIYLACSVLAAGLLICLRPGEDNAPDLGIVPGSEAYSDAMMDMDMGDIHRLELDLPAASVIIAPETEGTGIFVERWEESNPTLYYDVENGTLRLWTQDWEAEDTEPSGGTVYLYLPQELLWMDLKLGKGSISIHGLDTQKLDIALGEGEVCLERLDADVLKAEVGTGTLYLTQVASESLKASVRQLGDYAPLEEHTPDVLAEGHSTALVLERCRTGTLELVNKSGDLAAGGTFVGSITLEAPKGSAYFATTKPRIAYKISNPGESKLYIYHDTFQRSYIGGDNSYALQLQVRTAAYLHFGA